MQVKPIHYIGVQFTFFVNNNHSRLLKMYKEKDNPDFLTFPTFCYQEFLESYDRITNGKNVPELITWATQDEKSLREVSSVVPIK